MGNQGAAENGAHDATLAAIEMYEEGAVGVFGSGGSRSKEIRWTSGRAKLSWGQGAAGMIRADVGKTHREEGDSGSTDPAEEPKALISNSTKEKAGYNAKGP